MNSNLLSKWQKTASHKYNGFPDSSACKESAYNAGDPSSIPGLGRSPRKGIGYPFQYSCLKNSMDGWVWKATVDPKLGRSPVEGNSSPLQYSARRVPWTEESGRLQSMKLQRLGQDWTVFIFNHRGTYWCWLHYEVICHPSKHHLKQNAIMFTINMAE